MKIRTITSTILSMTIVLCSCNSQSKYDLGETIGKNATEVIGKNHYEEIDREMVTHQLAYEIREDMTQYSFGDIAFADNSGNNFMQLIVNSTNEKKIIGIFINVDNSATEGEKMKNYLDKTFGNPEIIVPEPTEKINGTLFGNSTHYWLDKQTNSSIYFYKNYAEANGKQTVGYSVEIIQNDAILSENPDWKVIDWYKTRF